MTLPATFHVPSLVVRACDGNSHIGRLRSDHKAARHGAAGRHLGASSRVVWYWHDQQWCTLTTTMHASCKYKLVVRYTSLVSVVCVIIPTFAAQSDGCLQPAAVGEQEAPGVLHAHSHVPAKRSGDRSALVEACMGQVSMEPAVRHGPACCQPWTGVITL